MSLRWMPILLTLGVASCTPPPADQAGSRPQTLAQGSDCGLRHVLRRRIPKPGSGETSVESGNLVPACALPGASDIASACRGPEGVPIPGSQSADDPDRPLYAFPDYEVEAPRCAFADASRGAADCTFDLVGRKDGPERITARLHHRFRDLSNAIAHDYLSVSWEADSVCTSRG